MRGEPTYYFASNPVQTPGQGIHVLFAGESQTKPGHRIGPKIVDYYLLHHVVTGKGIFQSGAVQTTLQAGDSFLIYPDELYQYEADTHDPWQYCWVAFNGEQVGLLLTEAGLTPESPVVATGADHKPAQYCRSIYDSFRDRKDAAALESVGLLYLLLAIMQAAVPERQTVQLKPDSHSEAIVKRMIGYMSTQYAEPLTIEGMAEALGYNRAYLSRLFKQITGQSPVSYLMKLRIDHGRRLLKERPELTIEQIASSVGVPDALYFSKQFRKWQQQSPSTYRQATSRQQKQADINPQPASPPEN